VEASQLRLSHPTPALVIIFIALAIQFDEEPQEAA